MSFHLQRQLNISVDNLTDGLLCQLKSMKVKQSSHPIFRQFEGLGEDLMSQIPLDLISRVHQGHHMVQHLHLALVPWLAEAQQQGGIKGQPATPRGLEGVAQTPRHGALVGPWQPWPHAIRGEVSWLFLDSIW